MRKRYVWDPKLHKLVYVGMVRAPNHNNTAQVGDIPDMMKDAEHTRQVRDKAYKAERKQALIDAVDHASHKPEADTYQQYMERELRDE